MTSERSDDGDDAGRAADVSATTGSDGRELTARPLIERLGLGAIAHVLPTDAPERASSRTWSDFAPERNDSAPPDAIQAGAGSVLRGERDGVLNVLAVSAPHMDWEERLPEW
jgi:hypothetical protein